MKAIILAAGRGERLRPLTDQVPKPLVKIGNKSLIEYHLEALARSGIHEVIINVAWQRQLVMDTLGDGQRYGVQIHYSVEPEDAPLETAGGIIQALPVLGPDPFLALSSDLWTDFPFQHLPRTCEGLAHLVLVDNPPYHPQGDFALEEGRITLTGTPKFNFGGIGLYHPRLFAACLPGRLPLAPLLKEAIQNHAVTGEYYGGTWFNIGTFDQLAAVRAAAAVTDARC